MRKLIHLTLLSLLLTSCAFVHKNDIQQGNIISQEKVNQLRPGMSKAVVASIMGTPVLLNTFNNDRVDYVYTYQPGGKERTEQYVTLIFKKGILQSIKGNMYSQFIKSEKLTG